MLSESNQPEQWSISDEQARQIVESFGDPDKEWTLAWRLRNPKFIDYILGLTLFKLKKDEYWLDHLREDDDPHGGPSGT